MVVPILAASLVKAVVDGKKVAAGNVRLMNKVGASVASEHDEGTAVYVAIDGMYAGCITISDVVKPTSKEAIAGLKAGGIKTVMLTGDTAKTAQRVGTALGIDEIHSELLPADKVAQVERLLGEKGVKENLAFVGDGINDAPVLSRADIGVAMGALTMNMEAILRCV